MLSRGVKKEEADLNYSAQGSHSVSRATSDGHGLVAGVGHAESRSRSGDLVVREGGNKEWRG